MGVTMYIAVSELVSQLNGACDRARQIHANTGKKDFDAGRIEGLNEALLIVQDITRRADSFDTVTDIPPSLTHV
jgi:hypothetical protein